MRYPKFTLLAAAVAVACAAPAASASSHREAPFITEHPKVDGTDFYMFRSYEPGRDGYVTLIANYLPLQDPYGGPNYFTLDPERRLRDPRRQRRRRGEDLTFQFRFKNDLRRHRDAQRRRQDGVRSRWCRTARAASTRLERRRSNVHRDYTVERHPRRPAQRHGAARRPTSATAARSFAKPVDNIGNKIDRRLRRLRGQARLRRRHSRAAARGRVFVGQRKDPFVVNLGEMFDLVNIDTRVGSRRTASANIARRQERDVADARSADRVPDRRQRARHRRLDDRQRAAGAAC